MKSFLSSPIARSLALAGLLALAVPAMAVPVQSAGALNFVDANTLVVADWRGGQLHALTLAPAPAGKPAAFNLKNVSASIARALHTSTDSLRFEDMAMRPGSETAYITLSIDQGAGVPKPALVTVDAAGKVGVVDLGSAQRASVEIGNLPAADKRLWRDTPQAAYTVTDMSYYDGKLYVAGLSNASFASSLRVFDFPFKGKAAVASIEMYHPVHNQLETRAPIRKMVIANLNGEPTLVAAFTCSPLVTIPLKDLKDGAHIAAKTVAEFGWGSAPVGMVSFDAGQGPMVLLTHSHKSADLMSVADIAAASTQPGIATPIKWPSEPTLGIKSTYVPITAVAHLSNQDAEFLAALRRNEASGAMELVSMRKGLFLRLSDFVNEYDFADFRYPANDGWRDVHRMLRTDEGYADLAPAKP
ncbi:hypothetical protein SNE35_17900 [Paucibacter sp. R3-3]|uniref:Amine dehydrogenase n=1 Tax=Roseateles agri TaxID=3098619 RepID=A0ABU5DJB3_9BURK|nr:hypothetical protein [Paucibacter sp. R3-3]MDY0746391.1 hypothetical protein [Paucibacter sp. R3-3]